MINLFSKVSSSIVFDFVTASLISFFGTPNAIFTLQKVSEKTVLATVNIAWEYGTMYKPIFKVEYSCSAVRTGRGSGTTTNKSVTTTNKTEQSRDYVGIAFKNYSVSIISQSAN